LRGDPVRALMPVVHSVLHPDCADPDCIEGVFTDEEIAQAIVTAGLARPAAPIPTCPVCGATGSHHTAEEIRRAGV
jgi:hypothetical protein